MLTHAKKQNKNSQSKTNPPALDAVERLRQPPEEPVDRGPTHASSVQRCHRSSEAPRRQGLVLPQQLTAKTHRGRSRGAAHHVAHLLGFSLVSGKIKQGLHRRGWLLARVGNNNTVFCALEWSIYTHKLLLLRMVLQRCGRRLCAIWG